MAEARSERNQPVREDDRVIPSVVGGRITVFAEGTGFSEVAYTAPELAVADKNTPDASAPDATVKCVYNDSDFYALIVSATIGFIIILAIKN